MTYRVADYIADALVRHGVTHVFTLTGGGAMHLNHAFATHPKLKCIYLHHEQACAYAAESFAKLTGRMAAVCVTTGPGALNAVTGVHAAYVDSIPMVVISGQAKTTTMAYNERQVGDQESKTDEAVKGFTKMCVVLGKPSGGNLECEVEIALREAVDGRPGPVWLDVPTDVQAASFTSAFPKGEIPSWDARVPLAVCDQEIFQVTELLRTAKRPVIYVGQGIRASGQHATLMRLLNLLQIPCVTSWNSLDLIPNDHPSYAGRPGICGTRPGNFTVQNADLLLILGCRLIIRQVSYVWEQFAPKAFKVMVDVDAAELDKPTLKIDLKVHADLKDFLPRLLAQAWKVPDVVPNLWLFQCRQWVRDYPVTIEAMRAAPVLHPHAFLEDLYTALPDHTTLVCGDGTPCISGFQCAIVKSGLRVYHNAGSAPMGYDLPAAIGAAIGEPERLTVCLTGDGSIMQNLQELQSIIGLRLPIKIFLLNNGGYRSIEQTQSAFFPETPRHGCGHSSGLTFPNFERIARAFGFTYRKADKTDPIYTPEFAIKDTLRDQGPAFCEVMLDPQAGFSPKLASVQNPDGSFSTPPLEDMTPLLPRDELAAVMKISENNC